jgi:SAM-dependent methyltransferase
MMGRVGVSFITKNDGQFPYFDTLLGKPMWPGKKVLDFGGNIGNILHHADSTIEQENYWCIDVSRDAVEAGKMAAPDAHFIFYDRYNFEYNPAGIRDLPIPDLRITFDYILALSVFTHTTRTEMVQIVDTLLDRLNSGGRLAFSFMDPHYTPEGSHNCNLRYYFGQRACGRSDQQIDALIMKARDAHWCSLLNRQLAIENEGLDQCLGDLGEGYLAFYTPGYLQTLFPSGAILKPALPFPRQHCCIIGRDRGC